MDTRDFLINFESNSDYRVYNQFRNENLDFDFSLINPPSYQT